MHFYLRVLLILLFIACNKSHNQLQLSFDNTIHKQDVTIKMEVLGSIPITEIYNGKRQFEVPDGYGENEWYFTYRDSLKGYSRFIKTNRNDKHDYNFSFHEENGNYFVDIDIEGVSSVKTRITLK